MYKLGRYQIKTKIGSGGMADILAAYDPLFEREVAIKVIKTDLSKNPSIRRRFKLEAQVMASLTHEAIVPIHDFGEYKGMPYFVMALMSGGSLTAGIQQGPLSLSEAIQFIADIAPALDMAHQEGVIHRDLKPDNILLDEAGRPYIADFGIAKLIESTIQETQGTSGLIGTPAYMSPEQIRGDKDIDGRSDIYSLGVILFQMLTGKRPYEGSTFAELIHKHLYEAVPNIHTFKAGLPVGCQTVIERAMAKNRDVRYGSASEMVAELKAVADGKVDKGSYAPTVPEGQFAISEKQTPNQYVKIGGTVFAAVLLLAVVAVGMLVTEWWPEVALVKDEAKISSTLVDTPLASSAPLVAITSSPTSTAIPLTATPSPTSTAIPATPSPARPTATQSAESQHLARGDAYYKTGEYEPARIEYNAAIAINPNDPLLYSKRGLTYYKTEVYDLAIEDFTQAIDLGLIDQLELVYNNRGNAYRHIGEYDNAVLDHSEAIRLNPTYSRGYSNRGVAYYKNQQYEKAILDFDQAIELEPNDLSRARIYNNRAKVYQKIGNYDQALADCNEAIRLDPEYSSAYNNRGTVYEDLGQFDLARADYETVLGLNKGYKANAQEALDRLK